MQVLLRFIVPVTALLAGLWAATHIGVRFARSNTSTQTDVVSQFDQLSSAEQKKLLNRTEEFSSLKKTKPAEWNRLQQLHAVVQADPALQEKLQSFHRWWTGLDRLQQQRLRNPDRTFVEDWPAEVERVFAENDVKVNQIAVGFPIPEFNRGQERQRVWKFSEQSFQAFLDDVLPSPAPDDLQERLDKFSGDCEITLTRILWLLRRIDSPFRGGPPGQHSSKSISMEKVRRAALEHLVPSELVQSIRARLQQERPEDADRWTGFVAFRFIGAGIEHYKETFRSKYMSTKTEDLVTVFESLDREQQLTLMRRDGKDSKNELGETLLNSQGNPAVVGLAEDLKRASHEWFMFLKRPPGGRGPGGGRGGPGGGRSRNGFGRRDGGPDDRRGDERDDRRRGDGRPGEDRFRPQDSGRKFEQRPPEPR